VLELQRIYCNGQLTWARRRGDTWICMNCGASVPIAE
jgi:ribosomal protein L40E